MLAQACRAICEHHSNQPIIGVDSRSGRTTLPDTNDARVITDGADRIISHRVRRAVVRVRPIDVIVISSVY